MARFLKKRSKAKGAPPGSFIFLGNQKMENSKIKMISYDQESVSENEYKTIEEALKGVHSEEVNWLNIDGVHDTSLIQKIGKHFDVSPLALENILNTGQRCKLFEDKESITLITKAVYFHQEINQIEVEQISFILLENTLISFQEKEGDHFDPVRERIRNKLGRIRKSGPDYLLFALIDGIVDNYLIDTEKIGEKIESLENLLSQPNKELRDC
jgi:magnesium transporter